MALRHYVDQGALGYPDRHAEYLLWAAEKPRTFQGHPLNQTALAFTCPENPAPILSRHRKPVLEATGSRCLAATSSTGGGPARYLGVRSSAAAIAEVPTRAAVPA